MTIEMLPVPDLTPWLEFQKSLQAQIAAEIGISYEQMAAILQEQEYSAARVYLLEQCRSERLP